MHPRDPRIRQTINQISQNLESANETAQEGIYAFSHNYLVPCFASIRHCLGACTSPCFPNRDDQLRRRKRGVTRGRAELNFDFYDDWDYDEDVMGDRPLGWGTDELDRLLAGGSITCDQPLMNRRLSYGARGGRRKSSAIQQDDRQDPTVIPSSSFLGFLERLPWRIGHRGLKYRPSPADLQENPGGLKRNSLETEPLLERNEESDGEAQKSDNPDGGTRQRSNTQSSQDTNTSLSSRGDLILGDEEEDAVPLGDEFAMALERRSTISGDDSALPRRSVSGTSISKESGQRNKGKGKRRRYTTISKNSAQSSSGGDVLEPTALVPTMADLKLEEEQARRDEEMEIGRKRQAALNLARQRGLSISEAESKAVPVPKLNGTLQRDNYADQCKNNHTSVTQPLSGSSLQETLAIHDTETIPELPDVSKAK
ncbi:hypothetical protein LOZ61_004511 [Ophidiomyces ophidiicola]|nr:hypothetical protein LOZ61_004511 [Ophidiomyces ophidiicola]